MQQGKSRKQKIKETNLNKYGTEYFSKTNEWIIKTKNTNLKEELDKFRNLHPNYRLLSHDTLRKLYIEEWMADKFEDYQFKQQNQTWLGKLFAKIYQFD